MTRSISALMHRRRNTRTVVFQFKSMRCSSSATFLRIRESHENGYDIGLHASGEAHGGFSSQVKLLEESGKLIKSRKKSSLV